MPSLFAEVFGLGGVLVVGNKLIGSRATDLGCFALIEQRGSAGSGAPADQPRRMGLGDGGVFVRAIEGPMHGVRGNAMEVAFLAEVARVSDEEPDLAVQDVIDLLGLVLMRLGVIARPSGGDHQAALVAVAFAHDHGAGAGFAALYSVVFRNLVAFNMQGHSVTSC